MSDATARLGLPVLPPTPLQPQVTHNEALAQLDALLFLRLLDRDLSVPPASPADGDAYLVKAAATGGWTGQDGKIAYALDGGWRFCAPFAGLSAYVADEHKLIFHDGSGWGDLAGVLALQNLPLLGVNTSADATNKLAVKSAALLFDNIGAGVQAKLNKPARGNTASLLYQTGYSGRAEVGLAGDDDLHFKTSPDGAAWREALVLKAVGRIGINTAQPIAPLELHVDGGVPDASFLSSDDFVIAKESNAIGLSGLVAADSSARRMVFAGRRSRGTLAAPTASASGDWTFSLLGSAFDGAAQCATAAITFAVDGAVSAGNVPQRIVLETGPAASRIERMRVNATGEVGIGKTAAPGVTLDVDGPVCVAGYAVAALPSAAQAGQLIYVGNESGGAVLAFSDGHNWRRVTDRAVVS